MNQLKIHSGEIYKTGHCTILLSILSSIYFYIWKVSKYWIFSSYISIIGFYFNTFWSEKIPCMNSIFDIYWDLYYDPAYVDFGECFICTSKNLHPHLLIRSSWMTVFCYTSSWQAMLTLTTSLNRFLQRNRTTKRWVILWIWFM